MKGGIGNLMKQAQLMQENMKRVQEQLGQIEVEGQAGSGMVKVLMTCKHDVRRVTIDPRLFSDEREMLEDLVAAAFNDAAATRGGDRTGKDGRRDSWNAAAAGPEAAVLGPFEVPGSKFKVAERSV